MNESTLAEQFASREVQRDAARLGMWVFLASEILLFAGLFALYAGYRQSYAEAFRSAIDHNSMWLGSINTLVLITSSLTAALGLWALRNGARRSSMSCLAMTLLLGAVFLTIKGFEYRDHFAHGVYPGRLYAYAELPSQGAAVFYTLYFLATGLHALHVSVGIAVFGWLLEGIRRGRFDRDNSIAVELGALYWHLVDIVWIFLWPLFYLLR